MFPIALARLIYAFVGLAAAVLLVIHTATGPDAPTVDTTSLGLLALLLLLPLAPYITHLRAAGFEAEIGPRELFDLRRSASDLPRAQRAPAEEDPGEGLGVEELTARDPQLGMAKLRMDLEAELRRVYRARIGEPRRGLGLAPMASELSADGVLPPEVAAPLREASTLANRAIHGEYVAQESAEEIAQVGLRVLDALRGLEA
jgi:hypothetical protein